MRKEDIWKKWKQARREPGETVHISAQVMNRIHEYETTAANSRSSHYLTEIPFMLNRLTRYAAAIGLSALGFYRLYSITGNLLLP